MIVDENLSPDELPKVSVTNNSVISIINDLLKSTIPNFKSYVSSSFYKKNELNENEFTQIFVEQAQILIRKSDLPFNINSELKDIHNLSKGFSDFYFYPNEEGVSTASIYSVESKRLPSPEKAREKEYVIGDKKNGGIERYKIERHGKNLDVSGIIGFIEKEDFPYWLKTINSWICDLSISNKEWDKGEILTENDKDINYCYLNSKVNRGKMNNLKLDHLWIKIS